MSREIKFRCWDNRISDYISFEDMPVAPMNESDLLLELENDVDITFEQYTGLKDKNGVEIYEGDIVKIDDGIGYIEYIESYFRIFKPHCFSINLCNETCKGLKDRNLVEVIGNIHQDAKLLDNNY